MKIEQTENNVYELIGWEWEMDIILGKLLNEEGDDWRDNCMEDWTGRKGVDKWFRGRIFCRCKDGLCWGEKKWIQIYSKENLNHCIIMTGWVDMLGARMLL